MDIRDIERGLFQMAKLEPQDADARFPLLSKWMYELATATPGFLNAPRHAKKVFDFLRELRQELTVDPALVEEMKNLILLEPAKK